MMTAETCSGSIPRLPVHHYHRRAEGYHDPQYQVAGYLAGDIDKATPNPRTIEPANAHVVFFGKMQIRESPSLKGAKTKLVTTAGDVYKAVALTWGSADTAEAMKIGGRDQEWVLLEGENGLLGWACYAETLKVADPKEQLLVVYGKFIPTTDIEVSKDVIDKGIAEKKTQIAAVNKWLAKNAPKSSGGSSAPKAPPAGSEDKSVGLSTTTMVMIGLGAAALVYFLIQQGKKK
jgi:hypothetical protein